MPVPDLEVAGLGAAANPFKLVPPDPNGDVGGGYYLQMVNVAFAIYDAGTGAKVDGPIFMSSLFDPGTQKLCATHDDGDPIVVYDEYADVWVISQFALNFNKPKFAECIAVSDTSDPTGAWFAYQFDYPNAERAERLPQVRRVAGSQQLGVLRLVQPVPLQLQRVRLRMARRRGSRVRA